MKNLLFLLLACASILISVRCATGQTINYPVACCGVVYCLAYHFHMMFLKSKITKTVSLNRTPFYDQKNPGIYYQYSGFQDLI